MYFLLGLSGCLISPTMDQVYLILAKTRVITSECEFITSTASIESSAPKNQGLSRYFEGAGPIVAAGRDGETVVKIVPSSKSTDHRHLPPRPVKLTFPVVLYRPVPPI